MCAQQMLSLNSAWQYLVDILAMLTLTLLFGTVLYISNVADSKMFEQLQKLPSSFNADNCSNMSIQCNGNLLCLIPVTNRRSGSFEELFVIKITGVTKSPTSLVIMLKFFLKQQVLSTLQQILFYWLMFRGNFAKNSQNERIE